MLADIYYNNIICYVIIQNIDDDDNIDDYDIIGNYFIPYIFTIGKSNFGLLRKEYIYSYFYLFI